MNSLSGRVVSIINQSRAFLSWDMRFVQNRSGRSQEQRKSIAFQAYASSNSSGSGRYLRHEQYWGLPDFTDRPNRLTPAHLQMASLKRPLLLDDYLFINEGKVDPERGYIVVTIDANTGEPLSLSFRPTNRRFRQIAGAMGSKREGENSSKQKSAQEPKSESIESPVKITGSLKLPGDSMSIRLGAFTLQESETSQSEWQKFWMVDDNQRFFTCELHPTHPELKMLVGKDKRLYMIPESIAVHIRKEIKSSAQWIRNSPRAK